MSLMPSQPDRLTLPEFRSLFPALDHVAWLAEQFDFDRHKSMPAHEIVDGGEEQHAQT